MIMAAPITMAREDSTAQNNALLIPGLTSASILLPPVAIVRFHTIQRRESRYIYTATR